MIHYAPAGGGPVGKSTVSMVFPNVQKLWWCDTKEHALHAGSVTKDLTLDICNGILKTATTKTSVLEYFLTVKKPSGVELKSSFVLTLHLVITVEYLQISNSVSMFLYI
jgi:hypothetical protein